MRAQYKKVIEDLFTNLSKSLLVILSITLGVLSLGIIFDTYCITDREMQNSYMQTNPASFIINVQVPGDDVSEIISGNSIIKQVESRRTVIARVKTTQDKWYEAILYIWNPKEARMINTTYCLDGKEFPGYGEILLENTSLSVIDAKLNDNVNVKLPLNNSMQLSIRGRIQADGTNPAWMHEQVIGYLSEDTVGEIPYVMESKEFLVVVSENIKDRERISSIAEDISQELESKGYHVNYIFVPKPGVHPNAAQMNAILLLFRIFGTLALILSITLVYSIISSVIQEQTKQIAIMKSLGAMTYQISSMYYLYVFILGAVAAVLAIPTAQILSSFMSDFTASILVFSIKDRSIPLSMYFLQAGIAIGIPILGATIPIQKGCRITVVKGLFNREKRGSKRKQSRFLFSILTLAMGGAVFMASVNVRKALEISFEQTAAKYEIDSKFVLSLQYDNERLTNALSKVDGIEDYKVKNVTLSNIIDEFEGDEVNSIYDNSSRRTAIYVKHRENTNTKDVYCEIERTLQENDIDILEGLTIEDAEIIYNKHLYTVASFLIAASIIVILVGIISLVSIAGMNVEDHIREIGIMRSFGANQVFLFHMLLKENLITGVAGFCFAVGNTFPLSIWIGNRFGQIFLGYALPVAFSFSGVAIWLGVNLTICVIISLIAVRKSVSKTVNEILAYE